MDTTSMETFQIQDITPPQHPWWRSIAEAGQKPEDSVELKRQKSLLTVVTLLKASICAGWYIPLALLGAVYAAAVPLFYQLATVLSVWLFARSKNLESFRSRQVLLILMLPMGVHFGLGGFAASGGVIIWSFLAPLISLLFEGPRQSIRWFLAFVGVVFIGGVIEAVGILPVFALPWWMKLLFYAMNFTCVTGIVYAGVRYFGHLLEKEKLLQVELNHQLQQANEHKSKFLAGMSHELRTPLNAIIGFTRIVKRRGKKTLPSKQLNNLEKVLSSADHLLSLINDILDLAKIEAGHIEAENSTFSLSTMLKACVNTSETLLRQEVHLHADFDPALPLVHSDEGKLKQIILNLLSNAAKFTHEGDITLKAHTNQDGLAIAVQDSGIGISEEAMQRIFGEFQQADSSTTRQYGGTGLGLSISYKLAQLLGASLSVKSVEGKGSTFTIQLPHSALQQPTPPTGETPTSASAQQDTGSGPKEFREILAIDDDPDVIYMLQESLQDQGYRVIGAQSGSEGIEKARTLKPFAITLDIRMPERDGWQTLHELKQNPQTKDIPVLMLSIIDNKQLAHKLGATDCLLKPLDGHNIRQALERLANQPPPQPSQDVSFIPHTTITQPLAYDANLVSK